MVAAMTDMNNRRPLTSYAKLIGFSQGRGDRGRRGLAIVGNGRGPVDET